MNEQVSSGTQIFGGSVGRLHPSGDFIYTTENALAAERLQKLDITGSVASWVGMTPTGHDTAVCGDLWLRADGN